MISKFLAMSKKFKFLLSFVLLLILYLLVVSPALDKQKDEVEIIHIDTSKVEQIEKKGLTEEVKKERDQIFKKSYKPLNSEQK